jgi:hypothetical protein
LIASRWFERIAADRFERDTLKEGVAAVVRREEPVSVTHHARDPTKTRDAPTVLCVPLRYIARDDVAGCNLLRVRNPDG